jgi:hypothetical protein
MARLIDKSFFQNSSDTTEKEPEKGLIEKDLGANNLEPKLGAKLLEPKLGAKIDKEDDYFDLSHLIAEEKEVSKEEFSRFDERDVLEDIDSDLDIEADSIEEDSDVESEDANFEVDSELDLDEQFDQVKGQQEDFGEDEDEGYSDEEEEPFNINDFFTPEEFGEMYSNILGLSASFGASKWSNGLVSQEDLAPSEKLAEIASKALAKIMSKMDTKAVNPLWVLIGVSIVIIAQPFVLVYIAKQSQA